jgi:hypothetical protein
MSKGGGLLENVGRLLAPQTTQGFLNAPLERQTRARAMDQGNALDNLIQGLTGMQPSQTINIGGQNETVPAMKLSTQAMPEGAGAPVNGPFGIKSFIKNDLPTLALRASPDAMISRMIATPKFEQIGANGLAKIDPITGEATKIIDGNQDQLSAWQKEQIKNQGQEFNLQMARLDAQDKRARDAEEARNRPQATSYLHRTTGNPIRYNPATGSYMDGENAVSASDLVASSDFNKDAEAARGIVGDLAQIKELNSLLDANSDAFEKGKVNEAQIKKMVPLVGDQWAASGFTPEQNTVRAQVAQKSAAIINKLYGAALSAGENERAASFAPSPNDTLEQLMPKLKAAEAWANSQKSSLLPGAVSVAERQLEKPAQAGNKTEQAPETKRPANVPEGAKQGKDGGWYTPDPARPGKYLKW